jgi:hypothetical protein
LVVDLRETFDARGVVRAEGSLRQWTNGNLQALLEPTAGGSRLRLRTLNGNARMYMAVGAGFLAATAGVLITNAATLGWSTALLDKVWFPLVMAAGLFALGALRLPAWARLRRKQMEGVASRLAEITESSDATR